MSASEFCIRACKEAPQGPALCQHIYDVMGCGWNMPGNYNAGLFEDCLGDSGEVSARVTGSTSVHSSPISSLWVFMAVLLSIKAILRLLPPIPPLLHRPVNLSALSAEVSLPAPAPLQLPPVRLLPSSVSCSSS